MPTKAALKQQAYRARRGAGLVVVPWEVDPVELAEFLKEHGVRVPDLCPATLAVCLQYLMERWNSEELPVTHSSHTLE
jgi:hypothetical protein